jgi:hypothetical protein
MTSATKTSRDGEGLTLSVGVRIRERTDAFGVRLRYGLSVPQMYARERGTLPMSEEAERVTRTKYTAVDTDGRLRRCAFGHMGYTSFRAHR